jgi:hypothetical protein
MKKQKKSTQQNLSKRWWLYNEENEIAPSWFSFLEWIFLVGALSYLQNITSNKWIEFLYVTSFAMLYLFIYSRFGKTINFLLDVTEIFVKNKTARTVFNVVSSVLSFVLISWFYRIVENIVLELQAHPI